MLDPPGRIRRVETRPLRGRWYSPIGRDVRYQYTRRWPLSVHLAPRLGRGDTEPQLAPAVGRFLKSASRGGAKIHGDRRAIWLSLCRIRAEVNPRSSYKAGQGTFAGGL